MNWMKYIPLYFLISALVIIPGLFSLAKYGLRLSIEFTGGSHISLTEIKQTPAVISGAFSGYSPTIDSTDKTSVSLTMKAITQDEATKIVDSLKKENPQIKLSNFETIGPALGAETIRKTINALLIVGLVLVVYISFAFSQLKFGVSAVLAAFHDTTVVLGIFSLLGHFLKVEVDLLFVTAVLTMLSYSVHDTIVVYDRIRELSSKNKGTDFTTIVNRAITETMTRSLNNSLILIFMLLAMFLMGGETTKYFALALLIGTVTGTYSSTFTAAPILVIWERSKKKHS